MAKSHTHLNPILRSSALGGPYHSSARLLSYPATRFLACNLQRVQHQPPHRPCVPVPHRSLAQLRDDLTQDIWYTPGSPMLTSPTTPQVLYEGPENQKDYKPPDERIVKLGKTLRILSSHLSTLLINPLPQEILSPNISLHLFPSTHPHLPTVKGKVAYRAALWTAPVAWGCMPSMPIVGNVRLKVLSERMVRAGSITDFNNEHTCGDEKLVVRWVSEGNTNGAGTAAADKKSGDSYTGASSSSNGTNKRLSTLLGGEAPIFKLGKGEQFTGLFIFSFDDQGRIASHTIEHADQSTGWDRTAKVVTLTDWLLGKAKRGSSEQMPEPAIAAALQPDELHRFALRAAMSGRGRC